MITAAVFGRYARALCDVAFDAGEEPRVTQDLAQYREIFVSVPELAEAFDSPAIPKDVKEKILSALLERYPVSSIAANFLRTLLQHNRLVYFQEICAAVTEAVHDQKGVVVAKVATAAPLSAAELELLKSGLSRITGKTVNLNVELESDLLGGLRVQIGSTVYDSSIRQQLSEMRRRLTEA